MYYFSIASEYGNLFTSCQKTKRTLSKGSFECKQAAKSMWTLNSTMSQPWDSTAYVRVCNPITRKRSLSTSMLTHAKGDSITFPVADAVYSNKVSVREAKPLKVAKQVDVTSIVRKQLDQIKKPDQKYYKIINLIANPQLAPLSDILLTLKKVGIVRQNKQQSFIPRGLYHMQNLSKYEIIKFYNSKIREILNFYRFVSNRHSLPYVI